MSDCGRRAFLKTGGALALTGILGRTGTALAAGESAPAAGRPDLGNAVRFIGDGLGLTPAQYSRLLANLTSTEDFQADVYAGGGIIEKLERKFAELLGKETAVFLPTGTMANHIALRRLAGDHRRVIVQKDSHIYNDSGDCAQKLSGLVLLPVADPFGPETVEQVLRDSADGRVKSPVGALSLESPLRRGFNTTHSLAQAHELADLARAEGIGLHLDGARLFMQAAHHGFSPAEYAAPFDTVYVSLYKNFNAAGGAVLAGSGDVLADLAHERRMFGGSPCHAWPLVAIALRFADGFIAEYERARAVTDRFVELLRKDARFRFTPVPAGSNSFWLHPEGIDEATFVAKLAERDVHILPPRPQWDGLLLMVNPTIARLSAEELTGAFRAAAGA